jgi:hypothetical protein
MAGEVSERLLLYVGPRYNGNGEGGELAETSKPAPGWQEATP